MRFLNYFLAVTLSLIFSLSSCRSFKVGTYLKEKDDISEVWSQSGGAPGREGQRVATLAPPFEVAWDYNATSAIGPTLVVAEGILYIATMDGRVDAIDIETGERLARKKVEGSFAATIAYVDRHLVVASRYGVKTLSLLDLIRGNYVWQIDAGDIETEPLIADGFVYVAALYKHIDKYDLKTGEKEWSFETTELLHSSPALAEGILVAGCDDGKLYALDSKDGELLWKFEAGASINATPVINNGVVFAGSTDSLLYAVDLRTGMLKWSFKAEGPIFQRAATTSSAVLFGSTGGRVHCLDALTGKIYWQYKAGSVISTAPLVSGNVVYFGSLDKHYYAVSLDKGDHLWSYETKGRVRTDPVVWGEYVFGASEDKSLFAFRRSDSLGVSMNKF
jgi:outer membrane protein assembly factor BamB